MNAPDLVVIAIGVLAFALVSRRAEDGALTAPLVFVLFGLAVSPSMLDLMRLPFRSAFMHGLAEITLALVLFTDAARIDIRRLNAQHDLPLRLLGLGLPLSIAAGVLLAVLMFPHMSLWEAGLLGVILAPTDAALGQAVVCNPRVPVRIRQALNVESGLNDGIAFPVLLVLLSLTSTAAESREPAEWLIFIVRQLTLGPLVGVAVGYAGAILVERAAARRWMNLTFLRISVLTLVLLAYGGAELIEGNGFIAAFAAGLLVGVRSHVQCCEALEDFAETEGQLLSLIVFLLFGATMVPTILADVSWIQAAYAVLSLTVVRLACVAASLVGTKLRLSTVLFLGWFGPRGLASILYLLLIIEPGDVSAGSDIFATVVLTVFLSVLAHGVTAAPAARLYGSHMGRLERLGKRPEHCPVDPFPVRPAIGRGHRAP